MAQPKKAEWAVDSHRPTSPRAALPMHAGVSPAHQLQRLLEDRALVEPEVERWSQRRALAFIMVSASALWLAIIATGVKAVQLIA